jgi:hypothetical protein
VPINAKLFRAIVVMGVSLTACDDSSRCHHCLPVPDDADVDAKIADAKVPDGPRADAGVDGPSDAPVDVVLII